ncbi:dTDP-4-dehydrorhamnose reductase [Nitrospira sp. KM1]|uniref:dTDP-4-dehydrorhamnose reductase n=1 Tax=Nitrospira sp. KM1 TaxID=1936990 RepID=UPI0013A78D67|nr:dTDP-4-dehydrorhamnose reductase [Nitrospira sp. KM1]BCA54197.1 dTDP-4-dehydrorhamnose reductase [Nitrospira sp. KM1]
MRILITGGRGQLGAALQKVLSDHDIVAKDLPEFDLTDPSSEAQILEANPEVIIHAGAYTNVDGAEREPARATQINRDGTAMVARVAEQLRARLMYVSTDYVFDGTLSRPYEETDQPNPLSIYGRTKYEGEIVALKMCRNTLIVRTAWLYGLTGHNFVKTIMRLAAEKPALDVVADQRGCPTSADDLAAALRDLARSGLTGICHVTNTGDCTWHEFATRIVRLAGFDTEVRPITTAQAGRLARRPAYSVLARRRWVGEHDALPHWHDALERFVKQAISMSLPRP